MFLEVRKERSERARFDKEKSRKLESGNLKLEFWSKKEERKTDHRVARSVECELILDDAMICPEHDFSS